MSAISVRWLSISWGAVIFETNYGLMQHSHNEIKNKLLRALDAEYNVVDMATVFEVVAVLEKIPITTEILENTRLGKVINEFRRKTSNEALAKRAKDLVRRWRNMMSAEIAGGSVASATPQQNRVESVPKTHAANKRLRKDLPGQDTEPPVKKSKPNGIATHKQILLPSPHLPPATTSPHSPCTPPVELRETPCASNHLNNVTNHLIVNDVTEKPCTPRNYSVESVPDVQQPLPKKRGRKKDTKHNYDIVKEKLVALSKTVKIKTTQELVNDLNSSRTDESLNLCPVTLTSNSTSLSNNNHQSDLNHKEEDDVSKNKSDHIEKFLLSQQSSNLKHPCAEDEIQDILSKLPPLDTDAIVWDDNEVDKSFSEPSSKVIIDNEPLGRLREVHIEGIDGITDDGDNRFKEWHEMVMKRTCDDDLIHILPYTIVD